MRKTLILLYIATCFCMFSCELHLEDNGALSGFWKLTTIENHQDGTTTDVSEDEVFWGISYNLINIHRDKYYYNLIIPFRKEGKQITFISINKENFHNSEPVIHDIDSLRPFGIYGLNESYTIDNLNNSRMTISSSSATLQFRKY